jgi:hypothetical protein
MRAQTRCKLNQSGRLINNPSRKGFRSAWGKDGKRQPLTTKMQHALENPQTPLVRGCPCYHARIVMDKTTHHKDSTVYIYTVITKYIYSIYIYIIILYNEYIIKQQTQPNHQQVWIPAPDLEPHWSLPPPATQSLAIAVAPSKASFRGHFAQNKTQTNFKTGSIDQLTITSSQDWEPWRPISTFDQISLLVKQRFLLASFDLASKEV